MKKVLLNCISLTVVFCMLFSFASCKKEPTEVPEDDLTVSTKATTKPVEIIDVPTGEEELTEMLNAAVEYIELYCYNYTKNVNCKVSDVSLGSLSAASNAAEAFRSIFGEKNITMNYSYNASRDAFSDNFPSSGYTTEEVHSVSAQQIEDKIVITATFPNETNPTDDSGVLYRLCPDYQNTEDIKKALSEFGSSATSTSIIASDITIKATIRAQDSGLEKLEVSYTQRYTLSGVTLVKLEGSTVTGTAKTTVIYSGMDA